MTRLDRLARAYAAACARARAAYATGDLDAYRYCKAEARTLRRALTGG